MFAPVIHTCRCNFVDSRWEHFCVRKAAVRLLPVGQVFIALSSPVPYILEARMEVFPSTTARRRGVCAAKSVATSILQTKLASKLRRRFGDTPLPLAEVCVNRRSPFCRQLRSQDAQWNAAFTQAHGGGDVVGDVSATNLWEVSY